MRQTLTGITTGADTASGSGTPRSSAVEAAAAVRRLIELRRNRNQFFGRGLFSDPAWDILLELYSAYLDRRKTSTIAMCRAAAVPATTALRWIKNLQEASLIERESDHLDGRRVFIRLTPRGIAALEAYFESLE